MIIKIKVKDLCLDYRDDIILMYYTLSTGDKKIYRKFCRLKANRKNIYDKLVRIYRSIKKVGQKTQIQVVRIGENLYPANGAHRIAALLTTGLESKIKTKIWKTTQCKKWNERRTLKTHHFKGLSQELLTNFLIFRKQYYEKIKKKDSEL